MNGYVEKGVILHNMIIGIIWKEEIETVEFIHIDDFNNETGTSKKYIGWYNNYFMSSRKFYTNNISTKLGTVITRRHTNIIGLAIPNIYLRRYYAFRRYLHSKAACQENNLMYKVSLEKFNPQVMYQLITTCQPSMRLRYEGKLRFEKLNRATSRLSFC